MHPDDDATQEGGWSSLRTDLLLRRLRAVRDSCGRADAVVLLTDRDRRQHAEVLHGPRLVTIPDAAPPLSGNPLPASRRQRPGWRLEVCGRGRPLDELAAPIADAGLAGVARMAGPTQQLGEVLASSAVFALSSRC